MPDMDFLSFFYPGFTNCVNRNRAAGRVVDEWDLLRHPNTSCFSSEPPALPLAGFLDAASSESIEFDLTCCQKYGIDALIFNYYFDGSQTELLGPLDKFSQADSQVRFAINLCCRMPRRKLPFGLDPKDNLEALIFLSSNDFVRLVEDLCERYLQSSRYYCWKGKALVCFYHTEAFIETYTLAGLAARLDIFRTIAKKRGVDLHLVGLFRVYSGQGIMKTISTAHCFDAFSFYASGADFTWQKPVQDYPEVVQRWMHNWEGHLGKLSARLHPCVGMGWNATVRGMSGYNPFLHGFRFPFVPVVTNSHPSLFRSYIDSVILAMRRHSIDGPLFLGPWNEWSEGCYMLPDSVFGYGWLEAVRTAKQTL